MLGSNLLDGFSRILDIQTNSGGGPPRPSLKNGIHGVNPCFTKLSSSPPPHLLLTTPNSQPGGKLLILESQGALSKNAYYLASVGQAPQTPEIRHTKMSSLVQREIENR